MAQLVATQDTKVPLAARLLPRRRSACLASDPDAAASDRDPRPTLAHVQVLELALEEQVRRVSELTEELAAARARHQELLRRLAATVEGLRLAFGKDPKAQRLLTRIDAALDRSSRPGELVRLAIPEPPAAPLTAVAGVPDSVPGEATSSVTSVEPRVLPVPPLAEEPVEVRGRRGWWR